MASESPYFSFLMCVHVLNDYVHQAIESIFEQTLADWELVIVANGKNAGQITEKLASCYEDDRVKLHQSTVPQLCSSLNYGINFCRGVYIVRMDSDDICVGDRLAQLKALTEEGYDVIGFNAVIIDGEGKEAGRFHDRPSGVLNRRSLLRKNWIIHPASAIKRETLLDVRGYSGGFVSEDYDLWLRISRHKKYKIYYSGDVAIKYRVHGEQAKGDPLAYAEVAGYMLRELMYKPGLEHMAAFLLHSLKAVFFVWIQPRFSSREKR